MNPLDPQLCPTCLADLGLDPGVNGRAECCASCGRALGPAAHGANGHPAGIRTDLERVGSEVKQLLQGVRPLTGRVNGEEGEHAPNRLGAFRLRLRASEPSPPRTNGEPGAEPASPTTRIPPQAPVSKGRRIFLTDASEQRATAIRVASVVKNYARDAVCIPVLKGISLTIARGEMVALMGTSGSGKTTLINLIGALDQPTEGACWIDDEEISRLSEEQQAHLRNRKLGFVFQNFNLLPRLTALENVMMPLAYSAERLTERERRDRARRLLERIGLGDRLDHRPSQLSGGQQQRIAIARALVTGCSVLIADEPTGNLDSKTGEDVLALFRRLNVEDGLTILLVTHDPIVASHADRVIRIHDGLIESGGEPGISAPATNGHANGRHPEPRKSRSRRVSKRRSLRFLYSTTVMALRSLRRNALRSALTTLGIIIGVAALIAISEIGKGSTTAIRAILQTMGATNLLVQAGAASRNGISLGSGTIKTLTPEDSEAILRECPAVVGAAPLVYTRQQVVYASRNWVPMFFYGTTPSFLRVREWEKLHEGAPFTEQDVHEASLVCLIGHTLADELFPDESPVGKEVHINGAPLRVLGVLARKGANIIGDDQDDIILCPWTTVRYRISGTTASRAPADPGLSELSKSLDVESRRYPRGKTDLYPSSSAFQLADTPKLERFSNIDSILARAASTDEIPTAMAQVVAVLRSRHHIRAGEIDDFNVRDFTEVIKAVQATVGLIAGLLLGAVMISLLVGGVGIMNIMLVTVTERYREIGLRMSVGASARDILQQFLIEAVVLSLLGGLLGIVVGRGGALLIREVTRWPTESSPLAVFGSVAISVTVGVIFGYYPAWKASRLNPIEALRYE